METIKTYEKGENISLSAHFHLGEFACHGRECCTQVQVDPQLVAWLEQIRQHFGKPITVTSGYRCPAHNGKIGGATASYHTRGMAADIVVQAVAPAAVAAYAQQLGILGIGLYETDADGYFVHLDTRAQKSFWYGQACSPRSSFLADGFIRAVQQALGVTVDGVAGRQTLGATVTVGAGHHATHPVVKPVQEYLLGLGYTQVGPADGIAGEKFTAALTQFQRDHGCDPTGVAEQWGHTWHTLLQARWGV